jgi:glycosyltransferase involved in cell wall biosynthesis
VFLNFRHINPLISNRNETETLKLVYLGRIQKRKGYETIFNFVDNLKNKPLNITVTFFGQIDKCDIEEFSSLVNRYSDYVKYEGELSPDQIQDRLSYYDVLLFPTTYYTEGLPGTIIDAFSAGLPVIATNWKHAEELICN